MVAVRIIFVRNDGKFFFSVMNNSFVEFQGLNFMDIGGFFLLDHGFIFTNSASVHIFLMGVIIILPSTLLTASELLLHSKLIRKP